MIKLAFIPIARPTFDVPLAEERSQQAFQTLQLAGYRVFGSPQLVMNLEDVETTIQSLQADAPDLLVILQASFADSTLIIRLMDSLHLPMLMWAVPEAHTGGRLRLNSFCGINLAGHALRRAGYQYDYLYAAPDDPHALPKIGAVAQAAYTVGQLRHTRLGRVGENPAGFETCLVNYEGLKNQFGVEVLQVDLQTVFEGARQTDPATVAGVLAAVKQKVDGVDELDPEATHKTLSTYVTLKEMAAEKKLQGMAVRCWPEFFTDLGCSACGAMSMLSDEHLPASCEADVNGTLTQFILQTLSGEPAFGSDVVSFDFDHDATILWHCGLAPLSMADPNVQPTATLHSNRKMPLLMQFPLKSGRVTLARLSEATGNYRLVVGSGEMLPLPPAFSGTTGAVRFDSGTTSVMDTILSEGLEHHISLVYGDYVEALLALARLLNLPVLRL